MRAFEPQALTWLYLNLAARTDRREKIEAEFSKHGITPVRFDAFTSDTWDDVESKVARMRVKTPGAIGCTKSHMAAIRSAQDYEGGLVVCEDDAYFCSDIFERLEYIAENLTWDWDIFYLGSTCHIPGEWYARPDCSDWKHLGRDVSPTSDPRIVTAQGVWGTYAYLVNPKNAERTYQTMDQNMHRTRGIDHMTIVLGPMLNTFCFLPGCAWQHDGVSDIRPGGFITRFSNFKPLGPYVWADNMNDFDPSKFNLQTGEYSGVQRS